jgi:hypothetical protein
MSNASYFCSGVGRTNRQAAVTHDCVVRNVITDIANLFWEYVVLIEKRFENVDFFS